MVGGGSPRADAHNQGARRLDASDAMSQNTEGIPAEKKRSSGRRPRKEKRKKETSNQQASEKHQRQEQNRQKHQRPARRATATSRHGQARQESLECGLTSLPRRSWNVMPTATRKFELHQTPRLETKGKHPPTCLTRPDMALCLSVFRPRTGQRSQPGALASHVQLIPVGSTRRFPCWEQGACDVVLDILCLVVTSNSERTTEDNTNIEETIKHLVRYRISDEIVAAATVGHRDAATSGRIRIAAAATAGQKDAATPQSRANRSPRTWTQPSRRSEPGKKETTVTAGNKRMTSVPVFLHRPGSRRLASGRIRQKVLNLVSLLPSPVTKS